MRHFQDSETHVEQLVLVILIPLINFNDDFSIQLGVLGFWGFGVLTVGFRFRLGGAGTRV